MYHIKCAMSRNIRYARAVGIDVRVCFRDLCERQLYQFILVFQRADYEIGSKNLQADRLSCN